MPELPEVEVMRRDLEREVVGKKIKAVEVTGTRSVRRHRNRKEFITVLTGRKITAVQRRGKYLVMKLDGNDALIVHLGMSGQLLRAKTAREKAPKHTHVAITFTQGGLLRFVDPRTFGEMFVAPYDNLDQQVDELAHLGLDPLETALSWDLFGQTGEYQQYHQVYDKEGQPCQRCRRSVVRARFSNRSTFFCEACQV